MKKIKQQWRDGGSGPGHMQAVVASAHAYVDKAYQAFFIHTQACADCRTDGLDCEDAAELRQAWRDAKAATQ
jgi:hypothetical protein